MTCAYGVENVGFVLITYGIMDAAFSFAFGYLIKKIGRIPIFCLGGIINFVVMIVLFQWVPNPNQGYIFFILAGLWGVADAVWQTQINGNHKLIINYNVIVKYILPNYHAFTFIPSNSKFNI